MFRFKAELENDFWRKVFRQNKSDGRWVMEGKTKQQGNGKGRLFISPTIIHAFLFDLFLAPRVFLLR